MKLALCLLCLSVAVVYIKAFPNSEYQPVESELQLTSISELDAGTPTDLLRLEGEMGDLGGDSDLTRSKRFLKKYFHKKKGYGNRDEVIIINQQYQHGGGHYGGGGYEGRHYGGGGGHYSGGYSQGYGGGYGGYYESDYHQPRYGW